MKKYVLILIILIILLLLIFIMEITYPSCCFELNGRFNSIKIVNTDGEIFNQLTN